MMLSEPLYPTHTARVFTRGVKAARAQAYSDELLKVQTTLQLDAPSESVFDCLRDLACLQDWWPHLRRIHALPGGLHGAGDISAPCANSSGIADINQRKAGS
jgi:uncharacterized membrane protein